MDAAVSADDARPADISRRILRVGGRSYLYHDLPVLFEHLGESAGRLPSTLCIVLEALSRRCGRDGVEERHLRRLAAWQPGDTAGWEIPFHVGRVLLQDFTGVPLVVDLAAIRAEMARRGHDPHVVEPRVPIDLVIDHSVQVDCHDTPDALACNLRLEMARNHERYSLLKWGRQAFRGLRIVPSGTGIVHQVNLERLAVGVSCEPDAEGRERIGFDTLVGTDSHTPMINGLGIVGWGVGGIEAEAAMLGQPVSLPAPVVVGVRLTGRLPSGATATDLALHATHLLRRHGVVGCFVEFFGSGVSTLAVPDRATVSNMAPEYGATVAWFPVDDQTLAYYRMTGRDTERVALIEAYHRQQGLFGSHDDPSRYSSTLEIDLSAIGPLVAGPFRPQDALPLGTVAFDFGGRLGRGREDGGFGVTAGCRDRGAPHALRHGSIVIAAITSCTNTSNPSVMLAAGLLARRARARGLRPPPWVKTSLAPGSRVVTDYLERTGLQADLDAIGFRTVAYGCTTCIGNSGPLNPGVEEAVQAGGWVVASVLSGNRNFEARIHPAVRANYLMSPPLVVAYALAGNIGADLCTTPLGRDAGGEPVYLRDLWPSSEEIAAVMPVACDPGLYRRPDTEQTVSEWEAVPSAAGALFPWDASSTYVQEPPFLSDRMRRNRLADIRDARLLAWLGDMVTTDHISPAGRIDPASPAGRWLLQAGVAPSDLNSYGSRRGHDAVMLAGTFANVRLRNRLLPGREGGLAPDPAGGPPVPICEAAAEWRRRAVPLIVVAGREYGAGSSRDWAAKGPALLGVAAVIAESFERIHRTNLVGMGIIPASPVAPAVFRHLAFTGGEQFDLVGLKGMAAPGQGATLVIRRPDGTEQRIPLVVRVESELELAYLRAGGILPYVLDRLLPEHGAAGRGTVP